MQCSLTITYIHKTNKNLSNKKTYPIINRFYLDFRGLSENDIEQNIVCLSKYTHCQCLNKSQYLPKIP